MNLGEGFLRLFELGSVDAPASAPVLHRVAQMQHLMEHDVLDSDTGDPRPVKQAADNNSVMGLIVMTECRVRRP